MHELERIAPEWPKLPRESAFIPDEQLVAREQWPALDLAWVKISPAALEADRETGHVTTYLLRTEGAPAPVATVSIGPVLNTRFGRGWYWRCGVHVIGAHCEPATPINADCRSQARSTTEQGAQDAARQHVIDHHPDAAVPYIARRWHALRTWN